MRENKTGLNDVEMKVLRLRRKGLTCFGIAKKLGIPESTVYEIYSKWKEPCKWQLEKAPIAVLGILFMFLFLSSFASAVPVLLSDQGTDVKESGSQLSSGNLTVLIYSASTGGTPVFNQTFSGAIINGSWNIMINPDLEFGRSYWKDYAINGINLNFDGQDRLEFTSPVGYINNVSFVNFSLIQNCPSGQAIRLVYANGSVVCENIGANIIDTQWNITGSNYMMNASSVLSVNETKLNNTIDARVLLNIPYQSSGAGWMNDSIQTNTSLNVNVLNGRNITTTGTGFFGFLGSLTSRITQLFVQNIDVSGNVNASGNVTAARFIGDGSLLTGISSGVVYTHLSNFTDDLGNRGYTSLSNFTNNVGFINSTQAQVFNDTAAIASKLDAADQRYNETSLINNKLDATDQRYNETAYINANFYTKTQLYNKTEIDSFGFVNFTGLQSYNETSLITSVNQTLSANKLDAADQRYNETAKINAVNTTANIDALGFLNKSGTNANQNINFSPYNITASKFIGDGSLLTGITATSDGTGGWTNTSTTTSTVLNVNVSGNVTASKFIGDGSLLTGISSGSGDGTGSWTNTSTTTSTGLNVNTTGNLDVSGVIKGVQAGNIIPFYYENQTFFPSATTYHGAVAHSHLDGALYYAHGGSWIKLLDSTSAYLNSTDGMYLIESNKKVSLNETKLNQTIDARIPSTAGYQSSAAGWVNDSTQTNTSLNVNVLNGRNITTTGTGFFGFLGSLTSRITQLFVQNIDVSGNVNASGNVTAARFIGDGSLLTGISGSADGTGGWTNTSAITSTVLNVNVSGNVTASKFIGDGSLLTGISSGSADGTGGWINTSVQTSTNLNLVVNNSVLFVNATSGRIGIGTQSPNQPLHVVGSANVTGNVTAARFIGDGSLLTNIPSAVNYTHLSNFTDDLGNRGFTSLSNFTNNLDFINSTKAQAFNDTALINAINTSANVDSLGFLNKSGTNVNQNINVNPYNITASHFIGDGSQLTGLSSGTADGTGGWTNTSTATSTSLNVNVSGNVTASKFIGDGSLLTNLPSGTADGTGGWTNTSALTSTALNVDIGKNLTVDSNTLFVDAGLNRVGIGTVTPNQALNVVGNANVTGNVTALYFIGNGSLLTGIVGSGITSLNGQTGPTQTFAVETGGSNFSISSASNVHTFNIPDASSNASGLVTIGTQTFAGNKHFSGAVTIGDSATETNNALLGVKTTTRSALADVGNKSNYLFELAYDANTNGNGVGMVFRSSTDSGNVGAAIIHERTGSNSQGKLHFYTKQSTTVEVDPIAVLTIDQIGQVGIGITSPTSKLHVVGNTYVTENVTASKFIGDGSLLTGISGGGVADGTGGWTNTSATTSTTLNVNTTGNITGAQLCIGIDCRSVWPAGSTDTRWNIAGSNYLINASGVLNVNETKLNATIDFRASAFNETSLINTKLDVTDQRYNETAYINANFYTKTQLYNKTEIDAFGYVNSTGLQSYNETSLIASVNQTLSANKLDAADQRYNETAKINAVNTTANIDALGFLNKSGTNANQNINFSPYNITASKFIGDGSLLTGITSVGDGTGGWTNSTTVISTSLNVNVSGNVTASKFIGDGSLLTNLPSGSSGGWTDDGTIVRLTSSGDNVAIGSSTIRNAIGVIPKTSSYAGYNMHSIYAFAGDTSTAHLVIGKSKDGTVGNMAYNPSSETLGIVSFAGADGSQFSSGANIKAITTQAWTSTLHGTKLVFQTTANGTTTNSDRMTIEQNGNIAIGATTNQPERLYVDGNVKSTANITASKFIGDGSLLTGISSGSADGTGGWTNTSTTTSTALNVNVSSNVTASKFIGDGSLLTGISSGPGDGTGGWTNTSTATSTSLNVNVSGNVTASKFIGDGSQLTGITASGDGTGGWTNTTTMTLTSLNVNITTGNLTIMNGRVGIGTASPSQALHVVGQINATNNISAPGLCLNGDCRNAWPGAGSDTVWNIAGSNYLINISGVLSANETKLNATIDSRASVFDDTARIDAINTTTNIQGLGFITGTEVDNRIKVNSSDNVYLNINSATKIVSLNETKLNATIDARAVAGSSPGGSNGQIQFNNNGNFGADGDLTWDNINKRLGIGTANPTEGFQTKGKTQTARFDSGYGSSSVSNVAYWGLQDDANNGGQTKGFVWRIDKPTSAGSSADLTLRLVQGFSNSCSGYPFCNLSSINGVGTDAVTFAGNGNVGIGTSTPGEKLQVNGNISVNRGSTIGPKSAHANTGTTSTQIGSITAGTLTGMEVVTTWDGSVNDEEIVFRTHNGGVSAGERFRIDKDGKLTGAGNDLIIMRSYGWASGDFGNDLDTGISATTYAAANFASFDSNNADDWTRFDVGADGDWHLMTQTGGRAQIVFYHKSMATRDLSG